MRARCGWKKATIVPAGAAAIVAATAAVAALALPSTASADVYCVDATPGTLSDNHLVDPSCHIAAESIKIALSSAEGSAEADTVLIGPGDYMLPAGVGPNYRELAYSSINAGNT